MDYSKLANKRRIRKQAPHATRIRNKISILFLRAAIALVLVAGFALVGAVLGSYMGVLNTAPVIPRESVGVPIYRSSFIICYHTNEVLETLHAGHNQQTVTLEEIPLHVRNAFLAIEDERFYYHNGIDIRSIGRAVHTLLYTGGETAQGASTITQQLIKNMLDRFDSDLITKLQEQYLAVTFERMLTEEMGCRIMAKDFILESYLNIINLGRQNYGVQAASWFYFGVDVSELSIVQGATIAAITQNPSRFPPDTRPENNWERTQLVLGNMLRNGFITEEEYEEAMATDENGLGLVYNTIFRMDTGATRPLLSPFDCFTDALLDQVRDDLISEFGLTLVEANRIIFTGGVRIYSTQDRAMQNVVDRAFLDPSLWPGPDAGFYIELEYNLSVRNTITGEPRHYQRVRSVASEAEAQQVITELQNQLLAPTDVIEDERVFMIPQPQGAFVLLDHHTGHVMAIRGIRGEKEGNRVFNRATQATRSPGSQMKPLVPFAAAFELGLMQPGSIIDDIPFTFVSPGSPAWTPGNWWGSTFEGLSTARRGIYRSMNVVSARAGADPDLPTSVGVPVMRAFLENFGFTSLHDNDGAAIVLGGMTRGVYLIELAAAYATIANMGEYIRPVFYSRVIDYYGNLLLDNTPNPRRVLRDATAYLLIDAMKDTLTASGATGGPVRWSNLSLSDIPIAGKTGTSQRRADLGFVGFTPYLTAAIWLGNDSNQPMHRNANDFHRQTWRIIMEEIHQNFAPRGFARPSGVVTVVVCRDSGLRATDACRNDPRGSRARTEVFAAVHAPHVEAYCTVHKEVTMCVHGYLAGEYCPPHLTVHRVGLVRPFPIDHITETVSDRVHELPDGARLDIVCSIHTEPFDYYDQWPPYYYDEETGLTWPDFEPNEPPEGFLPPAIEEPTLPDVAEEPIEEEEPD